MSSKAAWTAALALCFTSTAACSRDDGELRKELVGIRQEMQAIRAQLSKTAGAPAPQRSRPRPDPAKVYAVGIDGAPSSGKADAPLTVVMAYEYACPWCDKQRQAFLDVARAYGDDVRFVYRPLVGHPDKATDPALAACAGQRQGRFAEVDAALWRDVFAKGAYDRATVERVAIAAGTDATRLRSDMDVACKAWLAKEQASLVSLGATSTPTVWINGRPTIGYKSLEQLKPLLDEELARARERIAGGTPATAYYQQWVLDKGLTRFDPGT